MKTYAMEFPETVSVALEVLLNIYGTGDERVKKLTEAGYDAKKVQNCVNDLLKLMEKYK